MSFNFIKDKDKNIHFIGIGGISMSGLAQILLNNGFNVSGSDMNLSSITDKLEKKGAIIYKGHRGENIEKADLVVYTAAISDDNPEIVRAKELRIPLINRAEFLGKVMLGHKYNVAVAGTHGKTTTTSMISSITLNASLDPTILVGGELDLINGNVRTGNSEYFITEACEYKASFLKFYPYIGIILNIDEDHLDYYRDLNHIKETFYKFSELIPKDGYLVANIEDENVSSILKNLKCNIMTYGFDNGNIQAKNITFDDNGFGHFDVYRDNKLIMDIDLSVPGKHNVLNALSTICTSLILGIDKTYIKEGLLKFKGTHRRFETKGIKNNVTVIDDYAHHPTEIKATLSAAKNYPHKKLYCIFQPHTYSRTISLLDDFAASFDEVDTLILEDIYAAREKDTGIVSSDVLGDKIRERGGINCINMHNFEKTVEYLNSNLKDGDMLLTVGAGDVYKIGEMYLK